MSTDSERERSTEDLLARIEALTDAALGHLSTDDLLVELLDRVLEVLTCDTAAVLLLDDEARELVARAARGIAEEVRQGVRVPVGRGFAGKIAAQKCPAVLDRVDETTVWNPILWEKGIRGMLGVPLLSGGRVIGVLHVGTLGDRVFTAKDVQLLQLVADRVSGATQASLFEAEREAARALQESLLPTQLPECWGLEFAARYVPADQGVGGDWYDVFMLPSGEVWAVSGDVQGHGLRSAVVMGRLRSTIRAYALEGRQPHEALALTDRNLQHFEPTEMATVLCAEFPPPYDDALLSSAGHPPPVLATPDRPGALVDVASSPSLGAIGDVARSSDRVAIPEGAVLLLYTDGLIERRGETLDVGFERLCATVTAGHPEVVCHRVMSTLIGDSRPEDDVAVLAVRHSSEGGSSPAPAN